MTSDLKVIQSAYQISADEDEANPEVRLDDDEIDEEDDDLDLDSDTDEEDDADDEDDSDDSYGDDGA